MTALDTKVLRDARRMLPQLIATAAIVGLVYPFYEGIVWGERFHVQALIESGLGAKFHDFAGSVVVHTLRGWIALGAVLLLGPRKGRYTKDGKVIG